MQMFKLNDARMEEARDLARSRVKADEDDGRVSLKVDTKRSELEVMECGAFAEVGVSQVEGKPIRCAVHTGRGFRANTRGDDVAGWEVKGTNHCGGLLILPVHLKHKHKMNAKYLLVRCSPPFGMIVGWAWGHEFINADCIVGKGRGRTRRERALPILNYVARNLYEFEPTEERIKRSGLGGT